MSERPQEPSRWCKFLYLTGLKSKYIRNNGSKKELRRLRHACQNAKMLVLLDEQRKRMFDEMSDAEISDAEWQKFMDVHNELAATIVRFTEDARRYEWPILATSWLPIEPAQLDNATYKRDIPIVKDVFDAGGDGEWQ